MTPSYKVELASPKLVKQFSRLAKADQSAIASKVKSLAQFPALTGIVKLSGYEQIYRIRCGDYRIIFEVLEESQTVVVLLILHRKEVYRRLGQMG